LKSLQDPKIQKLQHLFQNHKAQINEKNSKLYGLAKMASYLEILGQKKSLKNICAIRGAKHGYLKWWGMLSSKSKMGKYESEKKQEKKMMSKNLKYYKNLG
jgi:hypothetical protein